MLNTRLRDQRGITIIEMTVVLSVLFVLAGAMSPIVSESVNTARSIKAKSDAGMIAMGLINLQKDLGTDALSYGSGVAQAIGLPDVLVSEGSEASAGDDADSDIVEEIDLPLLTKPGREGRQAARTTTRAQRQRWRDSQRGALDDFLMTNRRGYQMRRPGESAGWAGPYVATEIKGDPWGNRFHINARWLDGGSGAADSAGRARRAVFVVSPGANGELETPYEQTIVDARAYGDDIVIRIQ